MNQEDLIKQLLAAGATHEEASELATFGDSLKGSQIERSAVIKENNWNLLASKLQKPTVFNWRQWFFSGGLVLAGLSLVVIPVLAAQTTLPGQTLYPLKIVSEKAYQLIDPAFKDQISLRRSEEIKRLVENKADDTLIQSSLKNYSQNIESKSTSSKVKKQAVENLKQAEEKASGETKDEIQQVRQAEQVKGDKTELPNPDRNESDRQNKPASSLSPKNTDKQSNQDYPINNQERNQKKED